MSTTASSPAKERQSAINHAFVGFMMVSVIFASYNGTTEAVSTASFDAAKGAVSLALNLIGIMALWLGLVRILEAGGLMHSLAKLVKPVMVKLFPEVPAEHPAMSAMLLNISANMLGLGNAATPLGIKAMVELNKLNHTPGVATNAMCLFLAINTSGVTLLPLGAIGVRAAAGALDPASIFLPTLLATASSTIVGITAAKALGRRAQANAHVSAETVLLAESEDSSINEEDEWSNLRSQRTTAGRVVSWLGAAFFAGALAKRVFEEASNSANPLKAVGVFLSGECMSHWLMPALILAMILYGVNRGVKVYEAVTDGAKQGFDIAIRIIPYLVSILVAIAMLRASGALELLVTALTPLSSLIGLPAEVIPLAVIRPLSGSGAFGVMSALVEQAPNSYEAYVASTMLGSTETTFYVLAVYFGAVGVTKIRHALVAGLLADFTGVLVTSLLCSMFWTG